MTTVGNAMIEYNADKEMKKRTRDESEQEMRELRLRNRGKP